MTKLIIDAGILDALAGTVLGNGQIGLNLLLNNGNNIVITKAVQAEFELAQRPNDDAIQDWFTQNASRIEGLNFNAHVGDVGNGTHAGENSIRAYLTENSATADYRILTNDIGFYRGEINNGSPGVLRTPGQAAPPYRGVFDYLNVEAADGRLSASDLNHVGDSIYKRLDGANRLSPLFLDVWNNPNGALPRNLAFNLQRILANSTSSILTVATAGILFVALTREAEARGNGVTVADVIQEYGLSVTGQQLLAFAGQTASELTISSALGPVGWAHKAYELWLNGQDIRALVDTAHKLYPTNQAFAALNIAVQALDHVAAGDKAALLGMIDALIQDDTQDRTLSDLPYGEIVATEQSGGRVLEIYQVDNANGTSTNVYIDSETGEIVRLVGLDATGRPTLSVTQTGQVGDGFSTTTQTFNPTTNAPTFFEQNIYFGSDPTSYVTTSWNQFGADLLPTGAGNTFFKWQNLTWNFGALPPGAVISQTRTTVGGIDSNSLQWVAANQNPYLSINLSTPAILQDARLTINQTDWTNTQIWNTSATTYDTSGSITTKDVFYKSGVQTTTNYDTTNSYDWDFNTTNIVGGVTVSTSLKMDDGLTIQTDLGSDGRDATNGGAGNDTFTVDGWDASVHYGSGLSFDAISADLGSLEIFGADKVNLSAPILTGSQAGSIFGSTIGNYIAGGNVFAQIGTSAVLSTALSAIGAQFDKYFALGSGNISAFNAITNRFETAEGLGSAFALNVRSAGIGALTSYLTAELAEGLDVNSDGFGGQLFSYAASQGINKLASYAVSKVGEGLLFTDGISGSLFGRASDVLSTPILSTANIAAFAGSYLAREVVEIENIGGAIGQAVGSAIGTVTGIGLASSAVFAALGPVGWVAIPFAFAFGGTVVGTTIGNYLYNVFNSDKASSAFEVKKGGATIANLGASGNGDPLTRITALHDNARSIVQSFVNATGATIVGDTTLSVSFFSNDNGDATARVQEVADAGYVSNALSWGNGYIPPGSSMESPYGTPNSYDAATDPNKVSLSVRSSSSKTVVDFAVTHALKRMTFSGGDANVRNAIVNSNATTVDGLGLQVMWAQNYSAIVGVLEGVTNNQVVFAVKANFNDAVGTVAEAAWRVGQNIASTMSASNTSLVGLYVKQALQQTAAQDTEYLVSQIAIAATFGNIVSAAKAIAGGSWNGVSTPDFDTLDIHHNAGETNSAFAKRLEAIGVQAALAKLEAATGDLAVDRFVRIAVGQSTTTSPQILINQMQVARTVSARFEGFDTSTESDDSNLLRQLRQLGIAVNAAGTPNFNSFSFAGVAPTTVQGSSYEATLMAKTDAFTVDALKSAALAGDQIVIDAMRSSMATSTEALFKQLNVARGVSTLINSPLVGYRAILGHLGISMSVLGTVDYDTVNITATTEAGYQLQARSEVSRLGALAISGAQMTGDASLIAALRANTATTLEIVEKYEGIVQGLVAQLVSHGGAMLQRGATAFSKINLAAITSKVGDARAAAILDAAKILAFDAVKNAKFEGLDLYALRMLANTTAATFDDLVGDYVVVQDYRKYAGNSGIVQAMTGATNGSAFEAGWAITLVKAQDELHLDTVSSIDFTEGFASFLSRLDLRYWQKSPVEISPQLDGNTLVIVDGNRSGTGDAIIVADFAAVAGLSVAGGSSILGTSSSDLWQALNSGGTFTDADSTPTSPSHDVLLGGTGVDTIHAGDGNDYVSGEAGDDTIVGGAGQDMIVGGAGDDTLVGGAGNDTYGVDSSTDIVVEDAFSGVDDVYASANYTLGNNIERLMLIGSATTASGNNDHNSIIGNELNNSLYGLAGNDILYGRNGADRLFGGAGDDSYQFIRGQARIDGVSGKADVISEFSGADRLAFLDSGISRSDVSFDLSGSDLRITIDDASSSSSQFDQIDIANWALSEGNRIETIEFTDGTVIGISTMIYEVYKKTGIKNFTISGTTPFVEGSANDDASLTGTATSNIVLGLAGRDSIYGSGGNDGIDGGAGVDTVIYSDISLGSITADLSIGCVRKAAINSTDILYDIENVSGGDHGDVLIGNSASNALSGRRGDDNVNGGAGNDEIYAGEGNDTINGGEGLDTVNYSYVVSGGRVRVDLAAGTAGKSDGTRDVLNGVENVHGTAGNDELYGSAAGNTLLGLSGNDIFYGVSGADRLFGGAGDDTYLFASGQALVDGSTDNTDLIYEENGRDKISILSASISRSQFYFTLQGNDLLIAIGNAVGTSSNDQIKVMGWATAEGSRLEAIELADGTEIGVSTMIYEIYKQNGNYTYTIGGGSAFVDGSTTDDVSITGTATDNIVRGFAGKDNIYGSGGNDALDGGDGIDTALYFDEAIGAISADLSKGTVLKTGNGSTDILYNIESVSSGSFNDVLIGNAASNVFYGRGGNDIMRGGDGNDAIYAGEGTDEATGGSGTDTVYYNNGTAGLRVILDMEVGSEYAKKYVTSSGALSSTDIVREVENAYGTLNNDDFYGSSGANALWGAAGNDILAGRAGDDRMYGGTGNDTLYGAAGNDTYYFSIGDGQDLIDNRDASTATSDIVNMTGTGIAASNMWLVRNGNDLVVSLLASTDKMTFKNWYTDAANQIDQIVATDGKILRSASVQQLVNAMAGFSPSTAVGGTGVQPGAIPASVQTAINSAWSTA